MPKPKGKGAIISGIVLLVLGLVFVIGGIAGLVTSASGLIRGLGSPFTTPGSATRVLDQGTTYAVYEDNTYGTSITPSDVTVTGSNGNTIPVYGSGSTTQSLDSNGSTFQVVATFDPPTTGTYVIDVANIDSTVMIAPSLTSLARAGIWVLVIVAGVLAGIVGLILLIVGLVRRSSSRKAIAGHGYSTPGAVPGPSYPTGPSVVQPSSTPTGPPYSDPNPAANPEPTYAAPLQPPVTAPTLPPPGWYPDSQRPGGQRYWDGTTWTEHRA